MFVAKNCCHIFNCRRAARPGLHGVVQIVLPLLMLAGSVTSNAQQPAEFPEDRLTLATAVQLALRMDDPALQRLELRAQALEEAAVADAQLPDPMITGQIANVPTDSFRFDRDGMTQAVRVGLRQEFPAGKTLAIKGQRRRDEAAVQRSNRSLELERIRLETRQLWFSLFYHDQAVHIIQRSRKAVAEQIDSLAARFATGRMHAQDLLRTELELSLLDDQITEHQRQADVRRAGLARWIGTAAHSALPDNLP
nr:TolC family protein [Gammaproteobacteria bacterium]